MIPLGDSFFATVAGSAATLLGLSFFALMFFLTELFRRYEYEELSLPVHPDMLRSELQFLSEAHRNLPEHITDLDLLDRDPLVVFSAFSVGVSWNMYFVSLVVSLTAVSGTFANAWVFSFELFAFWCFLTFSLIVRNKKRKELATYRTRDEHLWAAFEWAFVGVWFLGTVCTFIAACAMTPAVGIWNFNRLAFWSTFGIDNITMVVSILKIISLGGLFFGLYVTNKDFFVYFKSKTSDRMRRQWLFYFIDNSYPNLKRRIAAITSSHSESGTSEPRDLWNEGCPPPKFVRTASSAHSNPNVRWRYLFDKVRRRAVATWMFDVSGIALWESALEQQIVQFNHEKIDK